MVTEEMLKKSALEAESVLISQAVPESEETHEFSEKFERKIKTLIWRIRKPSQYRFCRIAPVVACVLAVLIATAQITDFKVSKRISFGGATLDDEIVCVDENTQVINNATDSLPAQLPIYKIKKKNFTQKEFEHIQQNVKVIKTFSDYEQTWEMEDNVISGDFAPFGLKGGTWTKTEEELEKMAWETFRQIGCLEGEYVYYGIRGGGTHSSATETVQTEVLVSFYPVLDGIRVIGNSRCNMWFNDGGLVRIDIERYEYRKIGTMKLIPLEDAESRINTPDDFSLYDADGHNIYDYAYAESLNVEQVEFLYINQHRKGSSILQPIYNFKGTAILKRDGSQVRFSSRVIAVPEFYTYD